MAAAKELKHAEKAVDEVSVKKDKKEKKDKKDKKEKKEKKRSETDGVHKDKSDKKEKKSKKEKLAKAVEAHLESEAANGEDIAVVDTKPAKVARPIIQGALVDFALPLATDKYQKKVFKIVKKAAAQQALLRGVKEVNKALRKSVPKNPSASETKVPGIVVIAGDVNPAEIIMHLPLACEDVNAPYVFVTSRGELGQAARTKRPTSVVMVKAEGRKKAAKASAKGDNDEDESDDESYAEQYQELVKLTQKEFAKQLKGVL